MMVEDKAWVEHLHDGSLNPASYASIAAWSLVEVAIGTLQSAGLPITQRAVSALAQTYGLLVAKAQAELGARPSMQSGLHTRLRGALHNALRAFPPPFGEDEEVWDAWEQRVLRRMIFVAREANELWAVVDAGDLALRPWKALAGPLRRRRVVPGNHPRQPSEGGDPVDALDAVVALVDEGDSIDGATGGEA